MAIYHIGAWLLIAMTFIPLINHPHWFFRIFDFGKIQIFILQVVLLIISPFISNPSIYGTSLALFLATIYNGIVLYKYTRFFNLPLKPKSQNASKTVSIISANVYQDNAQHQRFIQFIKKHSPDIFLTMESDERWDKALKLLDSDYPYSVKIPLNNTYGMHLFSKLKMINPQQHFFVAHDLPSISTEIETTDGFRFKLYTLHPPPPSPTEEETSKERDGDLLSIAKSIRKDKDIPTIAIGDFNCVAWAKASQLFVKTSEMVDPRLGRGFISTFHAKYKILRFPIDQVYHTPDIFVEELHTLENVGSDHLPLLFRFVIDHQNHSQEALVPEVNAEELQEVNEKIKEGKEEQGNR